MYAAAVEAKTEIDPAFVTAQAMLETGWGARVIGKANLFGITKGSQWDGDIVMVKTHEYFKTPKQKFKEPDRIVSVCKVAGKNLWYYTVMRAFKDFDSIGDCLKEHERLFQKPGYKDAWPCRRAVQVCPEDMRRGRVQVRYRSYVPHHHYLDYQDDPAEVCISFKCFVVICCYFCCE